MSQSPVDRDAEEQLSAYSDGWRQMTRKIENGGSWSGRERHCCFLNTGTSGFADVSAITGLDFPDDGRAVAVTDWDHDGDLDVYIANHPVNFKLALDFFNYINYEEDTISSDKLYENIGGSFIDVTKKAGLNRDNGFGLSITTFDVNGDGWLDIYIANDFLAPDFLYISQQDKTFKNEIKERFSKLSLFSMGSDASDINNDGQLDLLVVDMDPHGHYRKKKYDLALPMEYYKIQKRFFEIDQFSKNMLFINDNGIFKDIAHLSGLASTEWSWSALIDDFDNDGFNDIAISNGLKKDFHERDYSMLKFDGKDHYKSRYKHNATALVDSMPRSLVRNFLFKNMDGYNFEDRSMEWGMHEFNSQGVAIADFDNDGDLDMVFNNTDTFSVVYRNNAEKLNNNYLRIKCAGEINKFGIGTVVEIFYDGNKTQKKRMANARGFQSSSEQVVHFGLGKIEYVDSLAVHWLGGKVQTFTGVTLNRVMTVYEKDARKIMDIPSQQQFVFTDMPILPEPHVHAAYDFFDFERDKLLPFQISKEGPPVKVADLNGDGMQDFIIGGAIGQPATVYFQNDKGRFIPYTEAFNNERDFDDLDIELLDYDGDGLMDIYIASGGNAFTYGYENYQDRLYRNNGNNTFTRCLNCVPESFESNAVAVAADFDNDGDPDLFIGARHVPGEYGITPRSALLRTDGGVFVDIAPEYPELLNIGLVKTALWVDLFDDGYPELIIAGEWMPITVFQNDNGNLKNITSSLGLDETNGWWNTLVAVDINNDGFTDLLAGNHGQNSIFKCSTDEPLILYSGDLDKNGSIEPIIFHYLNGELGPFAGRDELLRQMPVLQKKFFSYGSFANARLEDIISPEDEKRMVKKYAYTLNSVFLKNMGNKSFSIEPLPVQAQFAPVNAILIDDYDGDGFADLLLAGNNTGFYYNQGSIDALRGLLLFGDGAGGFSPDYNKPSGLNLEHSVRSMDVITVRGKRFLLVANNSKELGTYLISQPRGYTQAF